MISFTSAQLNAFITTYFFPLVRVLALLAAAPPFNHPLFLARGRLILGLAIAILVAPLIPQPSGIEPASGEGLIILAEQIVIGLGMGFVLRAILSAVDMAGNIISMQMGLGFAVAYDPQNASQSPVISELLSMLSILVFFSINGHLMVLHTLVESFSYLPIGTFPNKASWLNLAKTGGILFAYGVSLALPIIAAMLMMNITLGVLGKLSPQLNLMAVGFPITIIVGFLLLYMGLGYFGTPLRALFETALSAMLGVFVLR